MHVTSIPYTVLPVTSITRSWWDKPLLFVPATSWGWLEWDCFIRSWWNLAQSRQMLRLYWVAPNLPVSVGKAQPMMWYRQIAGHITCIFIFVCVHSHVCKSTNMEDKGQPQVLFLKMAIHQGSSCLHLSDGIHTPLFMEFLGSNLGPDMHSKLLMGWALFSTHSCVLNSKKKKIVWGLERSLRG